MTAMPQMVAIYNGMGGGGGGGYRRCRIIRWQGHGPDPADRHTSRRIDRRHIAFRFADRLGKASMRS